MPDDTDPRPSTKPGEEASVSNAETQAQTPPGGSEAPGDEDDNVLTELALLEEQGEKASHSEIVAPIDTHSVKTQEPVVQNLIAQKAPLDAVLPSSIAAQASTTTSPAAGTVAATPVVQATKQATQVAVSTAKQASQQVTAAVQNQAQKITVSPRKAVYRGKRFVVVYGGLVGVAGLMALLARRHRYFPADVGITRLIQKPNNRLYDDLMTLVSQLGWRWISVGTRASLATLMWAAGFRMESAFTVSTWSGDILTSIIKHPVNRPRPSRDLVRVVSSLGETSFPSGHVVHYVTFYGFLFYLVYTHLKQRWFRTALLTLLAGVILLVGPSRVYMGHHWPSDVTGAYLVGTLWLGVLIISYTETKANYTVHTHPPFLVKRPRQLK